MTKIDQEPNSKRYSDEQFADRLVKVGGAAVLFALFIACFYLFRFYKLDISKNPSDWGAFGDYVGGLANPVIGLATIVLVIFSINTQRRELRSSIQEMRLANQAANRISFEQTLFAWINNYHSLTSSISIGNQTGRQALQQLYDSNLAPNITIQFFLLPDELQVDALIRPDQAYIRLDVDGDQGLIQVAPFFLRAVLEFQKISYKYKSELDAPIGTLHQLIDWIDQSAISERDKWHYCTILKSQLSWIELVFLFYSNLTVNGGKFSGLSNKYALFDDLARDDFLLQFAETKITSTPLARHPQLRDGHKPWPYKSSAFSQSEAMKAFGLN